MIYPSKRALEKCKDSSAPLPAKAPKKASSWSPQTPKSEKSDQTTPCKQVDQDPVIQAPVKVVPRSAAKPRNPKKPRSPLAKKSRSQKKPRSPLAKKPGSPKKLRSPSAKKPGSPKSSPEAKSKTLKVGQRSPKSSGRVINLVIPSPKAKAECESPCATQVRKSNVNNTWDITIGTDFSVPDTPRIALQNMGYRVKQLWSCEKQMNCKKLASHTWGKKYSSQVFKNVLGRDPKLLPSCDLYISGVPCPPWARGGKREGLECEDGKLWKETILVVRHVQPKAFVIENVFGLLDKKSRRLSIESSKRLRKLATMFSTASWTPKSTAFHKCVAVCTSLVSTAVSDLDVLISSGPRHCLLHCPLRMCSVPLHLPLLVCSPSIDSRRCCHHRP